jgi:hypothetical protein
MSPLPPCPHYRRFTVITATPIPWLHSNVKRVTVRPGPDSTRWSFGYPLPRLAHLVSFQGNRAVIAESRRSDYDVTDTVLVSSAADVRAAIEELFAKVWPGRKFPAFAHVFGDFERMFSGRMPGYFGVDTVYHDQQHTLDITLATARLIVGHELQVPEAQKFGPERAMLGIVVALFHDVGYLRTTRDAEVPNGAEFTTVHVSRGASFLRDYLPKIDLGSWAPIAAEIIHYTGYERAFKNIVAPDPRDHKLGHLVGTADLMAQMADRCYLEKCRDRLYAEFVLAGVALPIGENGHVKVRYASGLDLLRQTPKFVFDMRSKRLDGEFNRAYRYLEILYNGRNPYMESIDRNLEYLQRILRSENWRLLRRQPPVFTGVEDSMATTRTLMLGAIKKVWG